MKQKFFRRTLLFFLVCLLLSALAAPVFAASGKASLGLSSRSVYVGDTVKVTVTYSSSTPMATWSFGIKYDSTRLKYVSGAQSTTGGTLNFVDQPTSGGVKSKSYTVTFKAIALGDASVSTVTREVYAEDYSSISVSDASRTISVVERPAASDENRLSALSAEGLTLSPAFDADTASYTATVPYATKSLAFTATARHSAAKVAVSGAESFAVGDNPVTVTVTAENGERRTYTVTVTRTDSVYAGASVSLNERTLTFVRDASEASTLPEGFLPVDGVYNGEKVLLFRNAAASATLAALLETVTDAEGGVTVTEHLYLYDEAQAAFFPYLTAQTVPQTYLFLNKPQEIAVPEGFEETILIVSETEITAWVNVPEDGEEPVTLVYAAEIDGEAAFYQYDAQDQSFVLYRSSAPALSSDGKTPEELEAQLAALKAEKEQLDLYWTYTVLLGGVLLAVLFLLVLILAIVARRRKKKLAANLAREQDEPLYAAVAAAAMPRIEETAPSSSPEAFVPAPEQPLEEPVSFEPEPARSPEPDGSFDRSAVDAPAPQSHQAPFAAPEPEEFVPIWKEEPVDLPPILKTEEIPSAASPFEEADLLTPSRPKKQVSHPLPRFEESPPSRTGHPDVERVFGKAGADELFRRNNPIIDEDAEEDADDAPIYGFDEE